ncbi:MAG: type II secretion system F family protein [Acidimicrobiales bacterium]
MTRALVLSGLLAWVGATLLLSGWRHVTRPSLARRLAPFHPARGDTPRGGGAMSVDSLREAVGPLAQMIGDRVSRAFGVTEPLDLRLRRIHSPLDVTAFRVRQIACAGAAFGLAVAGAAAGLPWLADVVLLPGAPLLAFLIVEQHLATASSRWQEKIFWELPVVAEQMAMLLNAGYSVGAVVTRLAERANGCCARDLSAVAVRIRHGVPESQALHEWAAVAKVPALDGLVGVLTLQSGGGDLGRLVSTQARQTRQEMHRRSIEVMQRRAQQVWVPVSVAALVPGVILLAIPFLAALSSFAKA